jgi:alpha-beta hydrolase superfamily lysophospholipase
MGHKTEGDFAAVARLLLDAGSPVEWQAPQPEPAEGINEIVDNWVVNRRRCEPITETTMLHSALMVLTLVMAQAPAGQRAKVNGMQMYYEVSGKGEPLVVLHGAYMNIPAMGTIIPELAKTHRVYALEFQGHGRTNDIDRPITYPNLADDVAAFMDVVGLKKADVFGYSMGAGAGLQLAIRHPEKVNRLVVASVAYDARGFQPEFTAMIPQMSVEMFPPQLEQGVPEACRQSERFSARSRPS